MEYESYLLAANAILIGYIPIPKSLETSLEFMSPLLLPLVIILASPLAYTLLSVAFLGSTWIFWLTISLVLGAVQAVYVIIQFGLIFSDVVLMTTLKTSRWTIHYLSFLNPIFWITGGRSQGSSRRLWRKRVEKCSNWKEYEALCSTMGIEEYQVRLRTCEIKLTMTIWPFILARYFAPSVTINTYSSLHTHTHTHTRRARRRRSAGGPST